MLRTKGLAQFLVPRPNKDSTGIVNTVTLETKFTKGMVGNFMILEKVVNAHKEPSQVNQVRVRTRRMPASRSRFKPLQIFNERAAIDDATFTVEVGSMTRSGINRTSNQNKPVNLGDIRYIDNKVATLDSVQVVLRIIANIPKPIEEDTTVLMDLTYSIQKHDKAAVASWRKWAAEQNASS